MASLVPFPEPTTAAVSGTTSTFPSVTIHPKHEPVEEDSLMSPPGFPTPPKMRAPPVMSTPLADQFPHIQTPYLSGQSCPGDTHGANVDAEYNQNTEIVRNQNQVVCNNDVPDVVPLIENNGNQVFFLDQVEHRSRSNELVRIVNLS